MKRSYRGLRTIGVTNGGEEGEGARDKKRENEIYLNTLGTNQTKNRDKHFYLRAIIYSRENYLIVRIDKVYSR